ncbi:universal stress protein [Paenibacillus sp. IB182496]|uniref:Universal stress protein n=1 Tax=Paenibacillus sabuli TaxID=2772509 RepID=A0A927BWL0_9BACL|nr:universal stress protein [Paenibacillus sabuli]MBD2848203.1 universal stress protein [Paenibacillus sabuli]
MPYQKLLVAYDGSEQSIRALKTGIDMAATWKARLDVLHVYEIPVMIVGEAMVQPPVESSVAVVEEADNLAAEARSLIAAVPDVNAEVQVLQGNPGKTILEQAEELGSDLIIIGSRGLGGIKEFFLGSVSHHVIQHAKVPIHVVK